MPKWSEKEQSCISEIRKRLHDQINESPPYPEVVGDRKIIRFLRGHEYNLDKVCALYAKFLSWRKDNGVNEIRKHIVEGGCDHPLKFPKGEVIISQIPQLVIAPDALDCSGSPVVVEQYNFSPSEAIKHFSISDYILYMTYCLEYRSIILEQLSEERETAFIQSLSDEERKHLNTSECKVSPYGVIVTTCIIRDLNGVGFEHIGSKGIEIISAVVSLASDNYPELMRKCYMINSPWIFNTAWYVIKQLLAPRTLAKISVMGSSYETEINDEIPRTSLPRLIGGTYIGYSEYISYPFHRPYLCPHLIHSTVFVSLENITNEIEEAHETAVETAEAMQEHLHHLLPIEEVNKFTSSMKHSVQEEDSKTEDSSTILSSSNASFVDEVQVIMTAVDKRTENCEERTLQTATAAVEENVTMKDQNRWYSTRSKSPENEGFDFCLISLTTSGY